MIFAIGIDCELRILQPRKAKKGFGDEIPKRVLGGSPNVPDREAK